jgi:hypothetical protein
MRVDFDFEVEVEVEVYGRFSAMLYCTVCCVCCAEGIAWVWVWVQRGGKEKEKAECASAILCAVGEGEGRLQNCSPAANIGGRETATAYWVESEPLDEKVVVRLDAHQ